MVEGLTLKRNFIKLPKFTPPPPVKVTHFVLWPLSSKELVRLHKTTPVPSVAELGAGAHSVLKFHNLPSLTISAQTCKIILTPCQLTSSSPSLKMNERNSNSFFNLNSLITYHLIFCFFGIRTLPKTCQRLISNPSLHSLQPASSSGSHCPFPGEDMFHISSHWDSGCSASPPWAGGYTGLRGPCCTACSCLAALACSSPSPRLPMSPLHPHSLP